MTGAELTLPLVATKSCTTNSRFGKMTLSLNGYPYISYEAVLSTTTTQPGPFQAKGVVHAQLNSPNTLITAAGHTAAQRALAAHLVQYVCYKIFVQLPVCSQESVQPPQRIISTASKHIFAVTWCSSCRAAAALARSQPQLCCCPALEDLTMRLQHQQSHAPTRPFVCPHARTQG